MKARIAALVFLLTSLMAVPVQGQQNLIIPCGLPDTLENRLVAAEQYYDSLGMHSLIVEAALLHPEINSEGERKAVRRTLNIEAKALRDMVVSLFDEHYTVDEIYADLAYRRTPHGAAMLKKAGPFTNRLKGAWKNLVR